MIQRTVGEYHKLGLAMDAGYLAVQRQHDEGGILTRWSLGHVLQVWRGVYKGARLSPPGDN